MILYGYKILINGQITTIIQNIDIENLPQKTGEIRISVSNFHSFCAFFSEYRKDIQHIFVSSFRFRQKTRLVSSRVIPYSLAVMVIRLVFGWMVMV